jgi:hypothetical protein
MADPEPVQLSPPKGLTQVIISNPLRSLICGLGWIAGLVVVWCLSFILYPVQLAFGIRAYRNPRYELKRIPKYLLITMLVLSSLEFGLLGTQLFWAYCAGSVEGLHLSIFKWWQHSKNFFVLCVFVAEMLGIRLYTAYLDTWLETTKKKSPEDKAEQGLLEKDVLDEKISAAEKGEVVGLAPEKSATSVVAEMRLEETNQLNEITTEFVDEKLL